MLSLSTIYLVSEWLIRIAMLVYVPQRRTPASARAWLLLIFFLPWLGLLLYVLIGRAYLPRRRLEQQLKLAQLMHAMGQRSAACAPAQRQAALQVAEAARLASNLGSFDVCSGNRIELLDVYDKSLDQLLEDIQRAQTSVHLLYYIFASDESGRRAAEALELAAARGVKCRVLMDSMGSRKTLRTLAPRLRAAGVEVVGLLPLRALRPARVRFDLRNHRKIAVIDGRIGYIGSQNIVNATANRHLTNEELVVRVIGPVVHQLQAVVLADRFQETGDQLSDAGLFPEPVAVGSSDAQVLPGGPGHLEGNTQEVLVSLVHAARHRIVLTTPYFVPDAPFLGAMRTVSARGVDVHLVVSRTSNKPVVQFAQQSYFEDLLDAGVKIHLYHGAFLHAKHVTIDDEVAVIGSSNLDIRSFALNSEVNLLVYDPAVVAELRRTQERHFANSEEITLAQWRRRSPAKRWLQNMCRLTDTLI